MDDIVIFEKRAGDPRWWPLTAYMRWDWALKRWRPADDDEFEIVLPLFKDMSLALAVTDYIWPWAQHVLQLRRPVGAIAPFRLSEPPGSIAEDIAQWPYVAADPILREAARQAPFMKALCHA